MPAPVNTPAVAPPPVAAIEPSCQAQLKAAGVIFEPTGVGPQPEPLCVVADAVKLTGLDPASGLPIDFPDRPTLACATALVFTDYLRTLLVPLTRGVFGTAVTAIGTGPGFECRTRDHIPGAKISAHGQGLAVDIADLAFANGRHLAIGNPKDETERDFDRAARAGGCGFFHTALGPGADSFHETHWHFDLQPRGAKGNAKICQ
ncbi:extensin family protein [Lichenifustis flavocetrariae]|uniref:Extensin family protein n=1 Tax=Lichenifustis flavocetrariae TaxID=2949735 RepID=A0AA42CMP0_9HYPH|nr:extensin family protein [Lichenifustis flavocetrariae]MCW6508555.1 extensin family protein [Lichenifustis flavocetrariae]